VWHPRAERRWAGRPGVRLSATLVAAGVVALAFTISGLLLVGLVHRSLVNSVDTAAAARARDVAALVTARRLGVTVASTGEDSSLVQVVGPSGAVLVSSSNIEGEPAALPAPPARRTPTLLTRSALPISDEAQRFRVIAFPVTLTEGPGWVYVASSLRQVDTTIARLGTALVLGLPVLLLLVTGVIWVAVGRALRPVERIRRGAASIGGDDLQRRVPVPHSHDEIARLAVTMNDMLARLEASAGRQRRFVGDASHELKSPLSALRAQVDVALAYPDRSDAAAVLARVQQQSARMAELIDDLLFLARADEGGLPAGAERVDLDELVLAEVHRLRELGGVAVTLDVVDAVAVVGSERDLTRMLRNLGDNAVAHARTSVEVGLTVVAGTAVITVTDDGPGVPVSDRSSLFERFTRLELDRSRHVSGGGTGLGLAITREIATVHAGTVSVGDRPDGQPGAVFTVRIPTRSPDQPWNRPGRRTARIASSAQANDSTPRTKVSTASAAPSPRSPSRKPRS
jgi:signal transduction histidine kinase